MDALEHVGGASDEQWATMQQHVRKALEVSQYKPANCSSISYHFVSAHSGLNKLVTVRLSMSRTIKPTLPP